MPLTENSARAEPPRSPPAPGHLQDGPGAGARRWSREPGWAFPLIPAARRPRGAGAGLLARLQAPGRGAEARASSAGRKPGAQDPGPCLWGPRPPPRRPWLHAPPASRPPPPPASSSRTDSPVAVPRSSRRPRPAFRALLPQPRAHRAPLSRRRRKETQHRPPLPSAGHRSRSRTVAALPTSAQADMQRREKKKKKFKTGNGCPPPLRRENSEHPRAPSAGHPRARVTATRSPDAAPRRKG